MKHKFLYILFVILLGSLAQPAQAGFFVKKNAIVSQSINTGAKNVETLSEAGNIQDLVSPGFRRMAYKGLFAKASLAMGILGFLYPLFAIMAILFGFIGMSRKNYNTGFAIAGFVLGLTAIVLTVFFGFTALPVF